MATSKTSVASTGKSKAGRAAPARGATRRQAGAKASKPASAPAMGRPESNPAIQAQVVIVMILAFLFLLFAVSRYT